MKFGPASPAEAIGGVTVHTLRQGSLVLKKGTTIGPAEVEVLNKAGVEQVVVVRLEEGDVSEDEAAASIAQAVTGEGIIAERAFTGRANLFAGKAGVLVVDRAAVGNGGSAKHDHQLGAEAEQFPDRFSELVLVMRHAALGDDRGTGRRQPLRSHPQRLVDHFW